ncbi:hypothetical protein ACIP88_37440 [Streptomyces uncialis]|uniref:hypothetical protein n=1 Tax=Streptomyces uncialis TaxID=1048205 RepID=UPI00382C369A
MSSRSGEQPRTLPEALATATVNTATAAAEARVSAATIRTWCRRGTVAAGKAGGRWAVGTASLARRIAIGAMRRTRKARPVTDAAALEAVFRAGTPVTLSGKFAGERVHLGHTHQVHGVTLRTTGLDRILGTAPGHPGGEYAVCLVDLTRLDQAPRLAALAAQVQSRRNARAWAAEQRAADEENRYLNTPEA